MFGSLLVAVILLFAPLSSASLLQQGRNSIEGRIITSDGAPLENVRVFLLSDGYSQLKQIYADSSGRYQFKGLAPGDYYVQVEPAGTGYERQTQRIEVNPFAFGRRPGAEVFRVDFVLQPDKTAQRKRPEAARVKESLIFYQDIPGPAKEAFSQAMNSLHHDDLKTAEIQLIRAIQIFPDYYEALEVLGSEYVRHTFYDSGAPLLAHAVEVNKNGWSAFYALGIALIELGKRGEGVQALRRAVELNPQSINASMRLGLELTRQDETRSEAIKTLTNVTHMAGKHLPEAYLVLALLYSKNKQYREEADALESYLQYSPASEQRDSIKRKIEDLRQKARKTANAAMRVTRGDLVRSAGHRFLRSAAI